VRTRVTLFQKVCQEANNLGCFSKTLQSQTTSQNPRKGRQHCKEERKRKERNHLISQDATHVVPVQQVEPVDPKKLVVLKLEVLTNARWLVFNVLIICGALGHLWGKKGQNMTKIEKREMDGFSPVSAK